MHKCGVVAIAGRTSSGKSTLVNSLVGQSVSITAAKPHTTRQAILGICTQDDYQIIYIDTPGWQTAKHSSRCAMEHYMQWAAQTALYRADVILWVWDWQKPLTCDIDYPDMFCKAVPVILAINKIDCLKHKTQLLPIIATVSKQFTFAGIIPISARYHDNLAYLQKSIAALLPENPPQFPQDQYTDQSMTVQLAETIRKIIIDTTRQEMPYVTAVKIEQVQQHTRHVVIDALVQVERPGQKAILLGSKGAFLKMVGTRARQKMEQCLGKKVHLRLFVKVQQQWTHDREQVQNIGYA